MHERETLLMCVVYSKGITVTTRTTTPEVTVVRLDTNKISSAGDWDIDGEDEPVFDDCDYHWTIVELGEVLRQHVGKPYHVTRDPDSGWITSTKLCDE
jgi:hypothetical protein